LFAAQTALVIAKTQAAILKNPHDKLKHVDAVKGEGLSEAQRAAFVEAQQAKAAGAGVAKLNSNAFSYCPLRSSGRNPDEE